MDQYTCIPPPHTRLRRLVFDDETVAEVDAERIKELYGGSGDWHIAYMCLFRKMETTSIETGMDNSKK